MNLQEYQSIKPPRRVSNKTRIKRHAMIDTLRKSGDTPLQIAISVLMTRSKLNWNWLIKPEERICIEFSDRMREATLQGKYRGIWGHIPNEGKRSRIVALIQAAMGMISGQTDHFFMWSGRGVIEFKILGGKLTANQECYRDWCLGNGINWALCHSADEGMETLEKWGAFL